MKALKSTRSVLVTALGVSLACSLPTMVMAKVSGKVCSDCHTMHSSQETAADLIGSWSLISVPRGALLANSCYGCHTGDAGLSAIGAPQVITTTGGAQSDGILPGGFFSNASADNKQHSIVAVSGADLATPPGWANDGPRGALTWTSNLVCAGTYGCHGDYSQGDQGAAVSGIHHRATALGYRGLDGIAGVESTIYDVKYNGYSATNITTDAETSPGTTISSLCAQCHTKFHDLSAESDVLSGGAWIRHPTDFALDSANQLNDAYTSYGSGTNGYNEEVPVGWSGNTTFAVNADNDVDFEFWGTPVGGKSVSAVICLSCHRAHGSSHPDLLRWSYTGMVAGSPTATGAKPGTGCFRCHTTKDDK